MQLMLCLAELGGCVGFAAYEKVYECYPVTSLPLTLLPVTSLPRVYCGVEKPTSPVEYGRTERGLATPVV